MHPGCSADAINSHLLQQNGILSNIIEEGHLYEMKTKDLFRVDFGEMVEFKRVGITKAISEPLFCNNHDTQIFKSIETSPVNFDLYRTHLLFSYRSLCGELRKKTRTLEMHKKVLNSNILNVDKADRSNLIHFTNLGIGDLTTIKAQFEREVIDEKKIGNFEFMVFKYKPISICVSAVFSPIQPDYSSRTKALTQEAPLNNVYVNVIPQQNDLIIILGYHKEFFHNWIDRYVNSWKNLDENQLTASLTYLIATRVESWSLSPNLFDRIPMKTKTLFLKYWNENATNLLTSQSLDFDLFKS